MENNLTSNYTFKTTAVYKDKMFTHFSITKELCSLYGDKPEDIQEISLKIAQDQNIIENKN